MHIILSIAPIFIVIALGVLGARKGLLPPSFQGPANRLAMYISFPALMIRAIAQSPATDLWQPLQLGVCAFAIFSVWAFSWFVSGRVFDKGDPKRGSWVQTSIHGNHGFVGLAVILYALGDEAVAASGLVVGLVSIVQNTISVVTLSRLGSGEARPMALIRTVAFNPIIIAIVIGLCLAFAGVDISGLVDRTLQILAGMGVPLALLIIGAKLGQIRVRESLAVMALPLAIKLMILPGLVWGLLTVFGLDGYPLMVPVLVVASPAAALSVVLADQMGGDTVFASAMVSIGTALSAVTFSFWLLLLHA